MRDRLFLLLAWLLIASAALLAIAALLEMNWSANLRFVLAVLYGGVGLLLWRIIRSDRERRAR